MNKMKNKYTKGIYGGLLLLLWGWNAPLLWAQQEPYFSLYRYEFNRQNPAAVGLVEGLQAQLHLRVSPKSSFSLGLTRWISLTIWSIS